MIIESGVFLKIISAFSLNIVEIIIESSIKTSHSHSHLNLIEIQISILYLYYISFHLERNEINLLHRVLFDSKIRILAMWLLLNLCIITISILNVDYRFTRYTRYVHTYTTYIHSMARHRDDFDPLGNDRACLHFSPLLYMYIHILHEHLFVTFIRICIMLVHGYHGS